jgi:hypothetical protein
VTRIGELGTALAVTRNRRTNALRNFSSYKATRRYIPEDAILKYFWLFGTSHFFSVDAIRNSLPDEMVNVETYTMYRRNLIYREQHVDPVRQARAAGWYRYVTSQSFVYVVVIIETVHFIGLQSSIARTLQSRFRTPVTTSGYACVGVAL